ncbi:TetR/AcrR family transcriptional regulator [Spongiibacter marinus]|uniref:TetR/AcrR family transcriptional regulator n=1 Tax=Spongiibacter marinus TaxID=354246 RepID=UPI0035BE2500
MNKTTDTQTAGQRDPAPKGRRVGRPAGSRREETIARIRHSAMHIFTAKGYAATSFKDIAKDIHVTPATLYQYFDSKLALYVSLFDEIFDDLRPRYERVFSQRGHLRDQLCNLMTETLDSYASHPEYSPFLAGATIDIVRDSELREMFSHRNGTLNDRLVSVFESAKQRGELPLELDSEDIASAFLGALMGIIWRQRGRQVGSAEKAINIFVMLIENRLFHKV